MMTFFEKDSHFNLTAINSFNSIDASAEAVLRADGQVSLMRLQVFEGGVTAENVKAHIKMFMNAPALFAQHVLEQKTVSYAPGPMPAAARPQTPADFARLAGQQAVTLLTRRHNHRLR